MHAAAKTKAACFYIYRLPLAVHAPQGYSSWVRVCVYGPVLFFQTVTNRPGRPTVRLDR